MRERIVLIGAGSAMFTRGLLADLLHTGVEADVALVDIDPQALDVNERMARKMLALSDAPVTVRAAVDRRDVLRDATAVICTVGVGGRRAWEQDVFVPRKYGIFMPVGDTVGPGGTSRALRMIPAMVDIARDVMDLAPDALFFNYGNPMAPVCRAVRKATGANVIGLCHGVNHVASYLARELDVPLDELRYTAVGYNHLTWFTDVRTTSHNLMPHLRALAAERVQRIVPSSVSVEEAIQTPFDSTDRDPFSWWLMHEFGAFPAVLDRHVTEFFPQFFREGRYYGRTLGVNAFSFEGTIAHGDDVYAEMGDFARSPDPLPADYLTRLGGEHEQVIEIIASIRNERERIYSTNLPNVGQVPNLPPDVIVESPAVPYGGTLRPLSLPPLSNALAGMLLTRYLWAETVVEAALEGSRAKVVQALVLDGAAQSPDQAEALADALLDVQAAYLPQFAQHHER